MSSLLITVIAGVVIGSTLGMLGGGGSILTVPVLVYLLHQSPGAATTGSLVVVGVTATIAAITAHRQGRVSLGEGVGFGALAIGGAIAGAVAAARVDDAVLMVSFAGVMLAVGTLMVRHQRQSQQRPPTGDQTPPFDTPIISFRPVFSCACPRAAKLLVTATAVGVLTGFLGVGGGFLIVPALLLVLAMPLDRAVGTSLVIIAMTSGTALAVRAGTMVQPNWAMIALLTVTASVTAIVGSRLAPRIDTAHLATAFTALVFVIALYTAARSVPALL